MYKKIFMGIAAVAALTLVSCSSDDLNSLSDNSSKNEAISFDGYLGRSAVSVNGSRGSVLEIADLQKSKDGFGVFGNYSSEETTTAYGKNWFDNEQVTYKTSAWTYEPLKYWLPKGHIDFLAYAPHDSNQKLIDNSKLNFTVSSTVTDQKDLLWANAANKTKDNIASTNNKVKFKFAHALAKIGYTVKTNVVGTATTITLNKITLAGSDTEPATGAFYTKGTIDLSKENKATGLWTNVEGKQYFTWFTENQQLTVSSVPNPNYLFVIPQDFSDAASDDLYVIVDYTINYNTGAAATMTSQVSSKITKKFEQGKAYTINLNIGLTPIEFNAEVNDWDPKDGESIDASWN